MKKRDYIRHAVVLILAMVRLVICTAPSLTSWTRVRIGDCPELELHRQP